jgi:hypothetical protein
MTTTMTVTKPSGKPGKQLVFKIRFDVADFHAVMEAVAGATAYGMEINPLWIVE